MAIDVPLVRRLVSEQFPQWSHLPVTPVVPGGWDNRTFRLGDDMLVRLPSAEGYAPQVGKEHRWLPMLAPGLPLPIPVPLQCGVPGQGYPYPWSVYPWLDGEPAVGGRVNDLDRMAVDLGQFLAALQGQDAHGGPEPGLHSGYRGGPLERWDDETRDSIAVVADLVDPLQAIGIWDLALRSPFLGPAVWFHGDVAAGNLLVRDGRLGAVIDFGCAGVGDPACDLSIAWTMLDHDSRRCFRAVLAPDHDCWGRGRGWALWKALITLRDARDSDVAKADESLRVLAEILNDPH